MGQRLPVRAQFTTRSRLATTNPLSVTSPVMPRTTASCSGPGARASRFQAMASGRRSAVVVLMRSFPIQGALAPFVDEPNRQNGKESHHRQETEQADMRQAHGPGEQERDFQVEDDEQERNEIEPDVEPAAGIVERLKPALI